MEEYSDEEKIDFFNAIYKNAIYMLELAENDNAHDDDEHHLFEDAFRVLNLRDKKLLWNYYNKIYKY